MCERCNGEPYRGVRALFNADLQARGAFQDRAEWAVLSPRVAVYVGDSSFNNDENPLFRGCETAISSLTSTEQLALDALAKQLKRPKFENF